MVTCGREEMGNAYFILIVGAIITAPLAGYMVGWICDKVQYSCPGLLILLIVAGIAFGPYVAALFGLAPHGFERVHGLAWMLAFFAGIHLSHKERRSRA